MTPEEWQQCLEESFGNLEPPYPEESLARTDPGFQDVIKSDEVRIMRWQELRPLKQYLWESLDISPLAPEACRYYLPAYLAGMTDPEDVERYIDCVLTTLWYEDENGELLYKNPRVRERWEKFTALLTDGQKRCIAHWLVDARERQHALAGLVDQIDDSYTDLFSEGPRIEHMLKRYWNAWL